MRWITLLGRIGTVILMIGLALLVASRINPPTGYTGHRAPISPEKYYVMHSQVYTPQTGFQISVESTDNIRVYLLGATLLELDNWKALLRETYPDSDPYLEMFIYSYTVPLIFFHEAYPEETHLSLNDSQTLSMLWNIAVLDKGLETHPEIILWDPPPGTTLSHEFFPEDDLYITVMVANPSSDTVEVETEIKDLTALAAKERVIVATRWLISIGIGLTIVWLVSRSKGKFEKALSDRR
jgi:hypothetical protein